MPSLPVFCRHSSGILRRNRCRRGIRAFDSVLATGPFLSHRGDRDQVRAAETVKSWCYQNHHHWSVIASTASLHLAQRTTARPGLISINPARPGA